MRSSASVCFVRIMAVVGFCAVVIQWTGCNRKNVVVGPPISNQPNRAATAPSVSLASTDPSPLITAISVDSALAKGAAFLRASSHVGHDPAQVLRALLQSGESAAGDEIIVPLARHMKASLSSTQAIADRLRLVMLLPPDPATSQLLKQDASMLLSSVELADGAPRFHAHSIGETQVSFEASAEATRALAEAARRQIDVPSPYWNLTEQSWRDVLKNELTKGPDISPEGLCAADLMPLLRALDIVATAGNQIQPTRADARPIQSDTLFDAALKQIESDYPDVYRGPGEFEAMEIFARIMRNRGIRFVGDRDWYQDGATLLLAIQRGDGSWGDGIDDTVCAMLFLSRNRAPLLFNKLRYADAEAGSTAWNNYPRDLAHLTGWLGAQYNRPFDWQVLSIDAPIEQWRSAPMLYISGGTALHFEPGQLAKLQKYVEQGGTIIGNADFSDPRFIVSFTKMGHELFPKSEFRDLPRDHPLFRNLFDKAEWSLTPRVRGLSNGGRDVMLLFPTDLAKRWEIDSFSDSISLRFAKLAGNMVTYATGDKFAAKDVLLPRRLDSAYIVLNTHGSTPSRTPLFPRHELLAGQTPLPVIPRTPAVLEAPLKTATLVMIAADSDPALLPRFDLLRAALLLKHTKLNVDPLVLGRWTLQRYETAVIPARQVSLLDPLQRLEIRRFIETGGTLFIDTSAIPEKAAAIEAQFVKLFADSRLVFGPATPADVQVAPDTSKTIRIAHFADRAAVIVNLDREQADPTLERLLMAKVK